MTAGPPLVSGTMEHRSQRAGARLIGLLAAITVLSQFYRVSGGVIAPELMRDLTMSPGSLGTANGAFFLALALLQLPCGMLFDRYGPRRTIAFLTAAAVAGALAHAAATSAATLILARFLLGVGCAGSFMGAVVLTSRWYPGERMTTVMSWVFAPATSAPCWGRRRWPGRRTSSGGGWPSSSWPAPQAQPA